MKYLLIWCFDRGFRSGEEIKRFDDLESAKQYLDKHKREMIDPTLYKVEKVEL